MLYCVRCGASLDNTANVCLSCGEPAGKAGGSANKAGNKDSINLVEERDQLKKKSGSGEFDSINKLFHRKIEIEEADSFDQMKPVKWTAAAVTSLLALILIMTVFYGNKKNVDDHKAGTAAVKMPIKVSEAPETFPKAKPEPQTQPEPVETYEQDKKDSAVFEKNVLDLARLNVKVSPEHADIKVLNIKPHFKQGMGLKPGTYKVKVSAQNYFSQTKKVKLSEGKIITVDFSLVKYPALTIKLSPQNAKVIFLGINKTYSPGINLPPGDYKIKVLARGYFDQTKNIHLKAGEDTQLSVDLVQYGNLIVVTNPRSAKISFEGSQLTYSTGMELPPGDYSIKVSAPACIDKTVNILVKAGRVKREVVELERKPLANSLGMEFVYIKPGSFTMGSPMGESGRTPDERPRRVTLSRGYYMQKTEVSQGQWKALMGNNPSFFKDCGDNCPVERVSWHDAQEFIGKLNAVEGHDKYRLPTEVEWEYACRAGSDTEYANGNILDEMGWYGVNSGWQTHAVAQKKANAWGLYDMHGNVYEWCEDWYWYNPSETPTDQVVPSGESLKVGRGGSWIFNAASCRSANRDSTKPDHRLINLGFRLVMVR